MLVYSNLNHFPKRAVPTMAKDMKSAKALFKKLVTDKGKERATPIVRLRLINETGHNFCQKCSKETGEAVLKPVSEFKEADTDYGYAPSCNDHRATSGPSIPPIETYDPSSDNLTPEELVKHYESQVNEALDKGKRVPKNLVLSIEQWEGIQYCRVCRHVSIKR